MITNLFIYRTHTHAHELIEITCEYKKKNKSKENVHHRKTEAIKYH
jgi:hypothetical protein